MYNTLTTLLDRMEKKEVRRAGVIAWGAPVPAFGAPKLATIATLGLNPSNREFVDAKGCELEGPARRFHTLESLRLQSWSEADARHVRRIVESCERYFDGNPYDRWFRVLDYVLSDTGTSYYHSARTACHLDLIPYATSNKWTDLSSQARSVLLSVSGDALAMLLRESNIGVIVLNGRSVVDNFERLAGCRLHAERVPDWTLRRGEEPRVPGIAYTGTVSTVCSEDLGRPIRIVGYNHNLQSSFGITRKLMESIRAWVGQEARAALC